MGLDVVELVMEIEEAFDIVIPDRDGERIRDLGDLYQFVLKQMGRRRGGPCLSSVTFYRVRRALVEAAGVERHGIAPQSRLEDLLPIGSRRWQWGQLRESLGSLSLAKLKRPAKVIAGIALASLAFLGVAAGFLYGAAGVALWGGLIAVAVWARLLIETALLTRATLQLTAPLAVCFPREYVTVRDVVLDLLAHHYGLIASEVNPLGPVGPAGNDCEVWDALCRIIAENLGIDRTRLTESTRLSDLW
jgi:hypothetical protein